jgi:hypothetical protein
MVSAHAARHPLRRAVIVGGASRCQPETVEAFWPGLCLGAAAVGTATARRRHGYDTTTVTSPRRLDGDGLLRLDGGVGESCTKATAARFHDDGLRSGSDRSRSKLRSFFKN